MTLETESLYIYLWFFVSCTEMFITFFLNSNGTPY